MAINLTIRINDSAHRTHTDVDVQKRKNIPLGDLIAYLVNQERKSELQKQGETLPVTKP